MPDQTADQTPIRKYPMTSGRGKTDVFELITIDGGQSFRGVILGQNFMVSPTPDPTPTPADTNFTYVMVAFENGRNNSYDLSLMISAADGGISGSSTVSPLANAGCGGQSTWVFAPKDLNDSTYNVTINWDSISAPHTRPGSSGSRCKPLTGILTRNGAFYSSLIFTDSTLTGTWKPIVISGFTSKVAPSPT